LSLGLRYEYNTPPHAANDSIERTFNDPALDFAPGLRSFVDGRTEIFEPDRNNFMPRVGVAYMPRLFGPQRLSVFRAGTGIFFDRGGGRSDSPAAQLFPIIPALQLRWSTR